MCSTPGCGAALDRADNHALTCRHLGSFGVRQNALQEAVLQFLSQAGIKDAVREAPSLLPGTAARPADIFVPNYAGTKAACLDFAVTHTQQPNTIERASVCAGAAAEQYELKVKERGCVQGCRYPACAHGCRGLRLGEPGRPRPCSLSRRHVRAERARSAWPRQLTCAGAWPSPCNA